MEMFTIGDTALRISEIFMVQRPFKDEKYGLKIFLKGYGPIDGWFDDERQRNNVYDSLMDAIEDQ